MTKTYRILHICASCPPPPILPLLPLPPPPTPFPFCPPEDMPPDSLISRWSLFAADRAAAPLWMGHFKLNSSPPHGCSLQRQAPVASCPSFAVKACFFEVLCSLHSHCKSAQQTRIVRLFEENAAVNATTTSAADATAPVAAATAHPVDWPHHTDYRAMSQLDWPHHTDEAASHR